MRLLISVKTNARKNEVEKLADGSLKVSVSATPIEGKANKAVIGLLAEYFDVPTSRIEIVAGHSAKQKHIAIS